MFCRCLCYALNISDLQFMPFAFRNGLFCIAKWAVSRPETDRFATQNGPCGMAVKIFHSQSLRLPIAPVHDSAFSANKWMHLIALFLSFLQSDNG